MDNTPPMAISLEAQAWLTYICGALGFLCNAFLIYVIFGDRKSSRGYQTILVIVAMYNMYYALMHTVVDLVSG